MSGYKVTIQKISIYIYIFHIHILKDSTNIIVVSKLICWCTYDLALIRHVSVSFRTDAHLLCHVARRVEIEFETIPVYCAFVSKTF